MKIIPSGKNSNSKIVKLNDSSEMDMAFIDTICNTVSSQESLSLIFKKMNTLNCLKKVNSSLYRYKNYDFCIGSSYLMQNTIENLKILEPLNLTSKPKLVRISSSKNNTYQLLVINSPNELIQYEQKEKQISPAQKRIFVSEMQSIALKLNKYNPCVLDKKNWFVDENNNIYIQDWSSLKEFTSEKEKQGYLKFLLKELNLVYC